MIRLVDLAHDAIGDVVRPGDIAIDATVGRGSDTLFLARKVGPAGKVYGFDVQPEAIAIARKTLREADLETRVRLVLGSHADLDQHIPREARRGLRAVMFNLGYLPGSDRTLTTTPDSTRAALASACSMVLPGGRISVLCYTGHPGGALERDRVMDLLAGVGDFRITVHRPEKASKAPPELVVLEKSKDPNANQDRSSFQSASAAFARRSCK